MKYSINPSPGMLVVAPLADEEMSAGGIWIPPTVTARGQSSVTVATVERINPPKGDDPENYFKIGQLVVCGKWVGTEIEIGDGRKYILVNEDSILATLEPADDNTDKLGIIST